VFTIREEGTGRPLIVIDDQGVPEFKRPIAICLDYKDHCMYGVIKLAAYAAGYGPERESKEKSLFRSNMELHQTVDRLRANLAHEKSRIRELADGLAESSF